jgi:hypothetical protein
MAWLQSLSFRMFVIKAYDGEGKKESDGNEYMDFKGKIAVITGGAQGIDNTNSPSITARAISVILCFVLFIIHLLIILVVRPNHNFFPVIEIDT